MTITILKAEQFQPLGKPIPRPAAPAPEPVQIKPGIWKNPDGKLETRNPAVDLIVNGGGKPVPKAPETPLPVLPNALGDGWIEWGGGECPIPGVMGGKWQYRLGCGTVNLAGADALGYCGAWEHSSGIPSLTIVAYRLLPQEAA